MLDKLKQWILNRKFVIDSFKAELERQREPIYIKAFTDARKDFDETLKGDIEDRAKELANKMLSDMLSVIDIQRVISVNPRGMVYLGNEQADEAYLTSLKSEAEMIETTNMWKILHETPKKLAEEAMFVKGETIADMQKGKSMLFTLATQKKILETVKSYKPKKNLTTQNVGV